MTDQVTKSTVDGDHERLHAAPSSPDWKGAVLKLAKHLRENPGGYGIRPYLELHAFKVLYVDTEVQSALFNVWMLAEHEARAMRALKDEVL